MCLAIPSKIVKKEDLTATVDVCGARREVNLMLLAEDVSVGDYVLVHAGFAMQKVDQEAAESSAAFFSRLVDEEKKRERGNSVDAEMSEALRRGTIRWAKKPRREA